MAYFMHDKYSHCYLWRALYAPEISSPKIKWANPQMPLKSLNRNGLNFSRAPCDHLHRHLVKPPPKPSSLHHLRQPRRRAPPALSLCHHLCQPLLHPCSPPKGHFRSLSISYVYISIYIYRCRW